MRNWNPVAIFATLFHNTEGLDCPTYSKLLFCRRAVTRFLLVQDFCSMLQKPEPVEQEQTIFRHAEAVK